jgi:hypothetical protein
MTPPLQVRGVMTDESACTPGSARRDISPSVTNRRTRSELRKHFSTLAIVFRGFFQSCALVVPSHARGPPRGDTAQSDPET